MYRCAQPVIEQIEHLFLAAADLDVQKVQRDIDAAARCASSSNIQRKKRLRSRRESCIAGCDGLPMRPDPLILRLLPSERRAEAAGRLYAKARARLRRAARVTDRNSGGGPAKLLKILFFLQSLAIFGELSGSPVTFRGAMSALGSTKTRIKCTFVASPRRLTEPVPKSDHWTDDIRPKTISSDGDRRLRHPSLFPLGLERQFEGRRGACG